MTPNITFVVPVADDATYARCFNSSPLLASGPPFEVFCQRGFQSAAAAFNSGIDAAHNDLVVFCHQDILLPAGWADAFCKRLEELDRVDANWGVVGCAGRTRDEQLAAHIYRHDRELCGNVSLPAKVRTLDECIIAFRLSSGLRFDDAMPGFFRYGVDICLQAEVSGRHNYAVDAPCFHQGKNRASLPSLFFEEERYLLQKWRDHLPIQTLSVGEMRSNNYLAYKRLRNKWKGLLAACGYRSEPWWWTLPQIPPEKLQALVSKL
jgi:hypothetical protein